MCLKGSDGFQGTSRDVHHCVQVLQGLTRVCMGENRSERVKLEKGGVHRVENGLQRC